MNKNIFIRFRVYIVSAILTAIGAFDLMALPASHYAASSALAEGSWAKIKVRQSGMQFVSNAQLAAMGFKDPAKVNVYGYGGRMISESIDASHPDDLPLLPSLRTAGGIVFFGVDHILWGPGDGSSNFLHTMQPYAEESFYFLSDRDVERAEMPAIDLRDTNGLDIADSFIERIVHEQDLFAPSISGRNLLGEDLRSPQQLTFALPGNVGGDASLTIAVGSNLSNASGSLRLSSSNAKLSANNATIESVKNAEQFMRLSTVRATATGVGESLNLGLQLSTSGVIKLARLDYVEVEYERALTMGTDQLYFYFNENYELAATLRGITGETEIWDVTTAYAPRKVTFAATGSEARFRVEPGMREFVAFNPSKVARAAESAGSVANQDIHAMPSPDMLIITPEEYRSAAERVAQMHRNDDGMTVHVLTPQQIYNEFSSGTPDVSAFRKAMKMWYDRDIERDGRQTLKYCLIYSRPTYDNKMATSAVKGAGYPRVPIWQSPTGFTDNSSYSTDDFIGMLDDNDTPLVMGNARIRVAVGRFPVRSLEEANRAADKLIAYTANPGRGAWRNNVLMVADDQDNGQHLDQSEKMYNAMFATDKGSAYQYERLYLDNFERQLTSVGMEYPEAKKRMMAKLEEGQALMTYIGHANTVSWTHEHLLNWNDINSFTNTKLPVLYAATCEFLRWDSDDYSGAEVLWANPTTGVISMICPSRSVFISMNGPLSLQFGKYALRRNADGSAPTLGDAYANMKNGIATSDDNKLRYALMGDPAMRMPVYDYDVAVATIDGTELAGLPNDSLPVLEARGIPVVKGTVTDAEGAVIDDFNGYVYVKLYDAEKVVETLGNGDDGKVMVYNDRKTKLYDGVAKVESGHWEITVFMPPEIENNYTRGRMTFYALADDGREANGATDRFHIYGYNGDAPEDNTGPEIPFFYLNRLGFKNGDVTYKTPVAYAIFSDESGINLSEAGIGHGLQLVLDGKTVFDDIGNFYIPDLYDQTKGSIAYQLPELAPGEHELKLTVWDCANNSSFALLRFVVAAAKEPDIFDIHTSFSADSSGVEFIVDSDRALASLACTLEVFDFNGIRVWHTQSDGRTGSDSKLRFTWDYTTSAGNRVDKGFYVCRATVVTPEGKTATKSRKIAIQK